MKTADPNARTWWMWLIWVVAGLAGLKYGFAFGLSISGLWMGVAMALTTAVFGTMMADGLLQWLRRAFRGRRDEP